MRICTAFLALLLLFPRPTLAKDPPLVFKVGRIHPVSSEPIENGVLVIEGNKIVAVGKQTEMAIPKDAVVRELPDAVIIPGLVDTHSHIGVFSRPGVSANSDGNESSGPVQPGLRAMDAIFPDDPGIRMATAGGVTTANIMPGSANVIGGQTLYVKLRGKTVEEMQIKDPNTLGGLKMANGENPKGYGRRGVPPFTRMKIASLQREEFIKAREYLQRWKQYRDALPKGEKVDAPDRDIQLEPLAEVLEKKRTVHFHCHRSDDLITALRIAEEFGFEMVIQHGTEGYRVADILAQKKIPVSLTLIDSPGGKAEVMGLLEENAAALEKAGVLVAINTDDSVTESRFYLRTGSIAVRGGMSEASALKALTLNPAKMMHLDHRLGSLEKGKEADFVILSGSPFSIYTQVLETYIDGVRVFDRSRKEDAAYQTGGFALRELSRLPNVAAPALPLRVVKVPPGGVDLEPLTSVKAIRAGRIHTINGAPILDGIILIEDGKIKAVGPAKDIPLPKGIQIVTAAEVTPGFIDTLSVNGLSGAWNIAADQEQDERGDPNQADLRVIDGFNPTDPFMEFQRANGVTIIHSVPGRHNVIAGQTGVFRTYGTTVEQSALKFPAGLLVNLGESTKESGKMPSTRMASAKVLRDALNQAKNAQTKKGSRNLKHEALQLALEKKIPVLFSAHRADDIVTSLRIAEEFQLNAILSLATEGYLIRETIEQRKVPVIVHPAMQRAGSSLETLNSYTGNAAALANGKIPITLGTSFEGYVPKTRMLRAEAAVAMTNGLGHERALRAVTLDAAKLLGIQDRFGSIEVGKTADLVLYDGDPLENATHVTFTLIDGKIVYSRAEYLKLPLARRALFAPSGGSGGSCCMGW